MRRLFSFFLIFCLTFFLAACDSAEERAEEHFQSALTLVGEGDPDRAIIELRNVFLLVPNHLEARHEIARIYLDEKDSPQQAYGQYLRLAEQYPDDLKARIELAELSFLSRNWDEMARHGTKARELDENNVRVQAIGAALDYRDAVEAEDGEALEAAITLARQLNDPADPNDLLRELILDGHLRNQELSEALTLLDDLTTEFPENQRYWMQRLQVLIALGDQSAVEEQLVDLVDRFPDDVEQKQTLVRYYLARNELDKTEAFLRKLKDEAPDGDVGAHVDLIRFLMEVRGVDEARTELQDAIAGQTNPVPFILLNAALDFSTGNSAKAIESLEEVVANSEPSDETNEVKVSLARMLLATENEVGARALVEAVLLEDPTQVGALKMNAAWLIEADETDEAIAALRTAIDTDPDDPETLTLMANAYLRSGSSDLARDFLALAVDASGNAPDETVRYAQLLISEERYLPAEDILLPALRLAPNNLTLLETIAQLYLQMEDAGRLQQVVDTVRRIDTDQAQQLAVRLEAARLNQSSGADEAIQYLEGLASGQDADIAARTLLLRARLASDDLDGAVALAEEIYEEQPDAPAAKLILATTVSVTGDYQRALSLYNELANEFPNDAGLQMEIAKLQTRSGQPEQAEATIAAALEQNPDDLQLLWASASYLEAEGEFEDAIAIYERMYALNSGSIVIANNLASLIATYRDDQESLDRAWTIARRFRESEQPAIQDTFGWITHRRGNSQEALPYLRDAAAALTNDAVVQYHLAEVLFALGENEEALKQYRITLDKAGVGDTRPQIAAAQDRIEEIEGSLTEAN